uniref:c-Myc-binding protein n=1 Tax=Anopheles minimus TaxID=112268 RepID=A0A182WDI2_9DIPT
MSNFKPIDLLKEDFRKYLDRQGVLDAITKVLVKCNTDRPENALAYVVENLNETHGNTKKELFEAHQEIERLKKEISAMNVEDKTAKPAPSSSSISGLQQEPEIESASASNGGGVVEMKTDAESSSVTEAACAAVTVKQGDVVTSSPSADRTTDTKPKETPTSSGNDEAQETAAAVAPATPNDAPDAKEPSTSESK